MEVSTTVPTIDLASSSLARETVVGEIGRACRMFGMFNVINHGIREDLLSEVLDASSRFFELPEEEKQHLVSKDVLSPVRFQAVVDERGGTKRAREFLKLYAYPLQDFVELWPRNPPEFRTKMAAYAEECRRVTIFLLQAIAESLGIVDTLLLADKITKGMQIVAVNCYRRPQEGSIRAGIGLHTDHSLITVVLQSSEGLCAADPGTPGAWKLVPRPEGSLLAIVGDHLEVMSNGAYKSAWHWAEPGPAVRCRVSISSFLSLEMDEVVEPAGDLVDEEHPRRYEGTSLRDFLRHLASRDAVPYADSLKIKHRTHPVGR